MAPLSESRHFAVNLRVARTARGLSQEALGERAGFSQQYISQLERGYCPPRPHVVRFARVLGLTIGDLLRAPSDPLLVTEDRHAA